MKVTIRLRSAVTSDGDTQQTDQQLRGFLRRCDNSYELTYREQGGEDALGNTTTLLRFFEDRLELSRQGDYRGLLVMEPGKRVDCEYHTPFGALTLTTHTTRLHAAFDDDGNGTVQVCYTLEAGGTSTHKLTMDITPA